MPRPLHAMIRERCLTLLAAVALHPAVIAVEVEAPVFEVNEALRFDWQSFRQVAGDECFLWTVATNAIALAAQRELVQLYCPREYAAQLHSGGIAKADIAASPAIIRALNVHGPGSVDQLAAVIGCTPATIQQQAAKFSDQLTVTKELVPGKFRNRHQWRITRIALAEVAS